MWKLKFSPAYPRGSQRKASSRNVVIYLSLDGQLSRIERETKCVIPCISSNALFMALESHAALFDRVRPNVFSVSL
jgi:hypothetical protein